MNASGRRACDNGQRRRAESSGVVPAFVPVTLVSTFAQFSEQGGIQSPVSFKAGRLKCRRPTKPAVSSMGCIDTDDPRSEGAKQDATSLVLAYSVDKAEVVRSCGSYH